MNASAPTAVAIPPSRVTTAVEKPYCDFLLQEWQHYLSSVPELSRRPLCELHLGGGTPTFLSPENLRYLLEPILSQANHQHALFEASIEVDPRVTTREHLTTLFELGFRRVSLGVQDYNPHVQQLINRIQPFAITADITELSRRIGFSSVNHDLIYGLPDQSLENMRHTIDCTLELRPDRIALYSYAHVPWMKKSQRLFTEANLPVGEAKRALYELARGELLAAGYREIGMDHFALPEDSLCRAQTEGNLHRNFMGYTAHRNDVLLGLGVSAISETPDCFHQNEKLMKKYEQAIVAGRIPTLRGHRLSESDQLQRERILQLMTRFRLPIEPSELQAVEPRLRPMLADGLAELDSDCLTVTERGRPFLRNLCTVFDDYLHREQRQQPGFSRSL